MLNQSRAYYGYAYPVLCIYRYLRLSQDIEGFHSRFFLYALAKKNPEENARQWPNEMPLVFLENR